MIDASSWPGMIMVNIVHHRNLFPHPVIAALPCTFTAIIDNTVI